jgi:predicted aldo/keto reductase-like oxidoreductase
LIQLHNLVHPDEWDVAMGPGGALEAAVEAREQGLVSYIGVTGHGLTVAAMHHRSLRHFDFDSVLLPYNYPLMQNAKYAADFERLVALCQERNVAVQTIKAITRGPWGSLERTHGTWYQPLTEQEDIDKAVHWVIGRPGLFLNTVGDTMLVPKVFDAASRFQRRTPDAEMAEVMSEQRMTSLFA